MRKCIYLIQDRTVGRSENLGQCGGHNLSPSPGQVEIGLSDLSKSVGAWPPQPLRVRHSCILAKMI